MRYEKADNLVQLALELQAARGNLSLAKIKGAFGKVRIRSDCFGAWSTLIPFFVSGNASALHSYSAERWARDGLQKPIEEPCS